MLHFKKSHSLPGRFGTITVQRLALVGQLVCKLLGVFSSRENLEQLQTVPNLCDSIWTFASECNWGIGTMRGIFGLQTQSGKSTVHKTAEGGEFSSASEAKGWNGLSSERSFE